MVRTGGDKNASTPRWFKLAHAVVAARKSSGDSVADFMVDEDDTFRKSAPCTLTHPTGIVLYVIKTCV